MKKILILMACGCLALTPAKADLFDDLLRDVHKSMRSVQMRLAPVATKFSALLSEEGMVSETEKEIKIRVEVPGFKYEDVSTELVHGEYSDTLRVVAQKEQRKEVKKDQEEGKYQSSAVIRVELDLGARVDAKNYEKSVEDGILKMTLKKQEPAGKKKTILK